MPELPEVETVARQLAPLTEGRRVRRLEVVDRERLAPDRPGRVAGRVVQQVRRVGKQVVLELAGDGATAPLWLAVHLRMTGRLIAVAPPPRATPPHLRARLRLDGCDVQFIDTRRFGTLDLHTDPAAFAPAGVEPLARAFTVARLRDLLGTSVSPLKVWLLRQDRIVGLGNIYASEILFEARLHPECPAGSLGDDGIARLHTATRAVLRRAIRHCGTTFSDFQDAHGLTGSYQQYLAVYARAGEPCRACRTPIARAVQAQRSTFWCPVCQPVPRRSRRRRA